MPDPTQHNDTFATLGHSKIQHGKANDRIYLMKLDGRDLPGLVDQLLELAEREDYSKIFCKVPASAVEPFFAADFEEEACVPGFYNGQEDGHFLSLFRKDWRRTPEDPERIEKVIAAARQRRNDGSGGGLDDGFTWRECTEADAPAMAKVYGEVFDSYPFPITEPDYLVETMRTHVRYVGAWQGERLAGLASSEMDRGAGNVEMTDFAVPPDFRGHGLSVFLLARMEELMQQTEPEIRTAYTIARSVEFGMNITFARLSYRLAGTLINNTHIAGRFESMNVWHKPL